MAGSGALWLAYVNGVAGSTQQVCVKTLVELLKTSTTAGKENQFEYPLTYFIGFVAGFDTVLSGDPGQLLAGAGGIIVAFAVLVLAISPLLVLWWLTRPSQPGPNEYGPNPHEVTS